MCLYSRIAIGTGPSALNYRHDKSKQQKRNVGHGRHIGYGTFLLLF